MDSTSASSLDNTNPIAQMMATIIALRELTPGYFLLTLRAPAIAAAARPGQFAQVRVSAGQSIDPLLARPISILRTDMAVGEVALLFKVVGRGTALLSAQQPGAELRVLGPIGNGFSVPETARNIALVAGGVGMPPLFFLAATLRRLRPELHLTLYYGGRTSADLLLGPEWEALGIPCVVATDDGSSGHHGVVTEPLREAPALYDFLAACGPRAMLRAVQQLVLAQGIPAQLSLEARMACGVGACLGCVCATVTGYRRVCIDGPVFNADEVAFDV